MSNNCRKKSCRCFMICTRIYRIKSYRCVQCSLNRAHLGVGPRSFWPAFNRGARLFGFTTHTDKQTGHLLGHCYFGGPFSYLHSTFISFTISALFSSHRQRALLIHIFRALDSTHIKICELIAVAEKMS